jgi:hypothetical protein
MAEKDDEWVVTPPPRAAPTLDEWTIVPPGVGVVPPGNFTMGTAAANWGSLGLSNRLIAAKRALTSDDTYASALEKTNKQQEQYTADNPWGMVVPKTAAGLASGVGLSGLIGKAIPALRSAVGLVPRVAAGTVEGGILGGLGGAGHTYSGIPSDYAKNAGFGTILGAGIGGAAPVAGTAAGKAYRWAADQGFGGGVPAAMVGPVKADITGIRNLPPGGMLPDAGPSMLGLAQGAVQGKGGPGKTALEGNLRARNDEVNPIIAREIQRLGPEPPPPAAVEAQIGERMGQLGPRYEAALNNARAVDNSGLALWLEGMRGNTRGEAQQAVARVRSMLDIPTNPGALDPHPRALQATREAVRGMRDNENLDPTTRGIMSNVYNRLTQELQAKVPGIREIDHAYAELGSQQRASLRSSAGSRVFQTDRENVQRPVEVQQTMTEGAQPKGVNVGPSAEAFRTREAALSEVYRIVGTKKNDLNELERVLATPQDWNAQKLGILFGQDRADRLMGVLQNLRQQRETFQKVSEGSQTAARTSAKEALDAPSDIKVPTGTRTAFGTITQIPEMIINNARQAAAQTQRDKIAQLLATRNPAEIQGLTDQILNTTGTRDVREKLIRTLVERGMISGIPLATGTNR